MSSIAARAFCTSLAFPALPSSHPHVSLPNTCPTLLPTTLSCSPASPSVSLFPVFSPSPALSHHRCLSVSPHHLLSFCIAYLCPHLPPLSLSLAEMYLFTPSPSIPLHHSLYFSSFLPALPTFSPHFCLPPLYPNTYPISPPSFVFRTSLFSTGFCPSNFHPIKLLRIDILRPSSLSSSVTYPQTLQCANIEPLKMKSVITSLPGDHTQHALCCTKGWQ